MSNWGCPHEVNEKCTIAEERACKPGIRGCILHKRFIFSKPDKNRGQNTTEKTLKKRRSGTSRRTK